MKRNLRDEETRFLVMLLESTPDGLKYLPDLPMATVEEMDDGGMGGLTFLSKHEGRCLGHELCSVQFPDEDGTPVVATINLDNYGELFELDVWKADFSPLKKFPEHLIAER